MPADPRSVLDRLRHVLSDGLSARTDGLQGWGGFADTASEPIGDADADGHDDAQPTGHRGSAAGLSRGVLLVCLAAVLVAVVLFWRGRPVAQAVPSPASGLGGVAATSTSEPRPTTTSTPAAVVVVHVVGRVNRPGLVRLPVGARVADAIAAAGGLKRRTDPATVNLARLVVDGEQLDIGAPAAGGSVGSGSTGSGTASGSSGTSPSGGLVDLNTATVEQLDALPGVGPVLAQRIVDQRTQNGRFTSVDDLRQVSGIGDKKFADLAPLVRV